MYIVHEPFLGEPGSSYGFKKGEGICSLSAPTEGMLSSSLLDIRQWACCRHSVRVVKTVGLLTLTRQWACCRDSAHDVKTIGLLLGQWVCCQDRGPVVETMCLLSGQWTCCQLVKTVGLLSRQRASCRHSGPVFDTVGLLTGTLFKCGKLCQKVRYRTCLIL